MGPEHIGSQHWDHWCSLPFPGCLLKRAYTWCQLSHHSTSQVSPRVVLVYHAPVAEATTCSQGYSTSPLTNPASDKKACPQGSTALYVIHYFLSLAITIKAFFFFSSLQTGCLRNYILPKKPVSTRELNLPPLGIFNCSGLPPDLLCPVLPAPDACIKTVASSIFDLLSFSLLF